MIKVGITGQSGFIGTHLSNLLCKKKDVELISFQDCFFETSSQMQAFVLQCDVIVHLAAVNRHPDPAILYATNIDLVSKLIDALEITKKNIHVIFSSSIQELKENNYGKSKNQGRELFARWAVNNNAQFSALLIPNVFGPFGKPNYNSVVATFCYQLINNQSVKIDVDSELNLIYVGELVEYIYQHCLAKQCLDMHIVPHTQTIKVSEILAKLQTFKAQYLGHGIIPALDCLFDVNLFNTFRSYIDYCKFYPVHLMQHKDERGSFVELVKLHSGGQVSYSTTKMGVTRGNHYHLRKIERFIVLQGQAVIKLRKINTFEVLEFNVCGSEPSFVDIPIWYTHNITNIGNTDLLTMFWINELFDVNDPDTFYEQVEI